MVHPRGASQQGADIKTLYVQAANREIRTVLNDTTMPYQQAIKHLARAYFLIAQVNWSLGEHHQMYWC